MTWFKKKTNEGSNPSQSVKFDPVIEAAKKVIRNTYTPVSMYLFPINVKTWTSNTTSNTSSNIPSGVIESSGALERLRKYLEENGVDWYRAFDRDAIVLRMPSGDEIVIDGFIFIKFTNQQDIVDYIMNQLDQFQE